MMSVPGPGLGGFHHAPSIPDHTWTAWASESWGQLLPERFVRKTWDANTSEIPFLFVHLHEIYQSSAKMNAKRFCWAGAQGGEE